MYLLIWRKYTYIFLIKKSKLQIHISSMSFFLAKNVVKITPSQFYIFVNISFKIYRVGNIDDVEVTSLSCQVLSEGQWNSDRRHPLWGIIWQCQIYLKYTWNILKVTTTSILGINPVAHICTQRYVYRMFIEAVGKIEGWKWLIWGSRGKLKS